MVTSELVTGELPKSRAGRAAVAVDETLVSALVRHLSQNPTVKNDTGEIRPNFAGPKTEYTTQGRAASAGRRYASRVAEQVDKIVRVSVYDNDKTGNSQRFFWRIYVPLSQIETPVENGDKKKSQ